MHLTVGRHLISLLVFFPEIIIINFSIFLEEEMTERETIAPERGIMTAIHQGGTLTAIATIAEEAAVAVTVVVVVAAGVGARTASETVTERGTGIETEIEIGIEIAAGAGPSAELSLQVGVEVRN